MAARASTITWQALKSFHPTRNLGTYLRPLPGHKLIYVKNPKAACSTVLVWLDRIHTGEHDTQFTNIHRQHRLPTVTDVGREQVLGMLAGGAYRFSFVRHPAGRLESVYWDKIVRKADVWNPDLVASLRGDGDAGPVPFERFLTMVEQQDPLAEMDPHWRPQYLNLLHPEVMYDKIGKLETFGADLEQIRAEVGLPAAPFEVRNVTARPAVSVFDGRPDLARRVRNLYAADYELYGYN